VQLADIFLILTPIRSYFIAHRTLVISSNATDLVTGQLPPLSIIALPAQSSILIGPALSLIFALTSVLTKALIRLDIRHQFARGDAVVAVGMVGH
jgi:hypothetical protein